MNRLTCLFCCFLSLFAAAQENMDRNYKIYDSRTRQLISIEKIISDMSGADVLFFGEEHNDSAGHYLEHTIFNALHSRYGSQVALSLEMFETDNQLVLNEYLAGFIDETRMSRDARLWSNYRDYRPMIEFAKKNKLPVIAANPPRRYVTMVSRRGMRSLDSLTKEARSFLPPLPYDTLTGRYREKFFNVMKGSPGGENPRVYHSQSLWDAGMGYSIYRYYRKNKDKKIFHCVGKFHVEENLGTAAQLKLLSKKIRIRNISCFPDESFSKTDPATIDWEKFGPLGDYIIFTNPALKKTY